MPLKPQSFYEMHREAHRRHYDKAVRVRVRDNFYQSAAWRECRARILSISPLCAECQRQGKTVVATDIHHRIERLLRPDLAFVDSNLEALCHSCHSRLSAYSFGKARQSGTWAESGS